MYNVIVIYVSYYLSVICKIKVIRGLPVAIAIEPTTSCNLRCPECPSGLRQFTRPTGMLDKKLFERIINEQAKTLLQVTLYFQGEPFLHPEFTEMIQFAALKNIYTVTSTNAHYLNDENAKKTIESKLDKLIISVDGTSQEIYSKYRVGGQLATVIEGTKNILIWRKKLKSRTPRVIFQLLVVKPNEHQISDLYRLAEELGVDEVKLKTAQINDFENGNELIPTIDRYSRYKKQTNGTWTIKNKLQNKCLRMWSSCVITWDGMVVPCCFDKDASYQMGNLKLNSLTEIWNNENYYHFRKSIVTARKEIAMCKNCSEGTKVWA